MEPSGPYQLKEYPSATSLVREQPAATTERPVLFWEAHATNRSL